MCPCFAEPNIFIRILRGEEEVGHEQLRSVEVLNYAEITGTLGLQFGKGILRDGGNTICGARGQPRPGNYTYTVPVQGLNSS